MLDADKPFSSLSNKEEKRMRALILMTDRANTKSVTDPYLGVSHDGTDTEKANKLTSKPCDNIKSTGVDIWTVAYKFDDADSKKMLKQCATSHGQFFDASDKAALIAAFESIGDSLFSVRLTR